MWEYNHPMMDTDEYKALFKQAKSEYPQEYDYFLQVACIAHLKEEQDILKSAINIETQDEVQEEHSTQ
jgi:hypothetical protein